MLDPFTFAAAIAAALASLLTPAPQPTTPPTHTEVISPAPFVPACQEDEPCWDCSTMGNQQCGPVITDVPNSGGVAYDDKGYLYQLTLNGYQATGECVFAAPCHSIRTEDGQPALPCNIYTPDYPHCED